LFKNLPGDAILAASVNLLIEFKSQKIFPLMNINWMAMLDPSRRAKILSKVNFKP
jgi:hypothetical protein